jgi:ubiquinone/menaquinone biosynthesis C-methylase UbiE
MDNNNDPNSPKPIDSSLYDEAYYLQHMGDAQIFVQTQGQELSRRLEFVMSLARIQPGEKILDIGCGRGEILLHSARQGVIPYGVDYADYSMKVAGSVQASARQAGQIFYLTQANARQIPYASDSFDCIFALDIVEHLYPAELAEALHGIWRVLRPGGRAIIHTMPNADYYRWGYPLYRALNFLVGKKLPVNPRDRSYRGEVHVNEQTPRSLRQNLKAAGFAEPKVWLHPIAGSRLFRQAISFFPWRWVLVNDIFAVAVKS